MFFRNIDYKMKDGTPYSIRSVKPEEAGELLRLMKQTSGESLGMLRYPDDTFPSVEAEERYLEHMMGCDNGAQIGAYVDGKLIGCAGINCPGVGKRKVLHRCEIGLSIEKKYWDQQIGTRMIEALIELAQRVGYEQMELEVFTDNERAIHVYKKMGFEIYGTRPNAMKLDDGTYQDEHLMVKYLFARFDAEEKATSDLEEWIEEQGIQLRY